MWRLKPSLPSRQCNARGHSPNSLVPHVPAYHLLRSFACTSRASALPALAVDKSLNHWASEAFSHLAFNAKWPWPQAGNLDASLPVAAGSAGMLMLSKASRLSRSPTCLAIIRSPAVSLRRNGVVMPCLRASCREKHRRRQPDNAGTAHSMQSQH